MSTSKSSNPIRFGNFEVDPRAGELRKHGRLIKLQEQPIQLLLLLLEHPGEVVTREEARNALWREDTFVDFDHGLGAALNRLRAALGDSASNPRFIETLPRHGYRFIAPVAAGSPNEPESVAVSPPTKPVALRYGGWAVAFGALMLSIYLLRERAPAPTSAGADTNMLVVLPFDNLSGNPEQEYFSDGLTEEIITHIGRLNLERLGVIARTSSMAYKNTTQTIGQIGQDLGVNYVLEGSVRREGGRVRITAQLISVKDQTHVWAESYDRELQGILALQSDVSRHVAEAVAGELGLASDPVVAPELAHTDAYEAYLKGRFYWNKRDAQGFQKAIEYFQEAIDIDPRFAPAYAGLADCYALLSSSFDMLPPGEAQPKARAMAKKALEIDPNLAEAYVSLGVVRHAYDWDWAGASEAYLRAIELNPSYATAYHWHALHLAGMGRFEQALDEMRRARALDPLSLIINTELGRVLYTARRYEEATEQLQETLGLDPHFVPARIWLSIVYLQRKMFEEAIEVSRTVATIENGGPTALALLGASYAAAGKTTDAMEILQTLKQLSNQRHVSPASIALVYANLGDPDEAFAWLEKAFEQRSAYLRLLKVDPVFDPLRSDPRFQGLLTRMNFPE